MNESHTIVSNSLEPHGLNSSCNSPGQNTGVDSLSLLQGIFSTQGSNPGLPQCGWILYQLSHKRSCHGPASAGSRDTLRMNGICERDDTGRPSLGEAGSVALFSKGAFIPWFTHFQKWKMQSHAESAQRYISLNLYRNQDVFCISFHLQGSCVMYIIFWPRGLLTFYDPFLIKAGQPENLFFP